MIYIFLIDGTGTCDRIKEDKFVSAENLQGVYDAVVRNIDFFFIANDLDCSYSWPRYYPVWSMSRLFIRKAKSRRDFIGSTERRFSCEMHYSLRDRRFQWQWTPIGRLIDAIWLSYLTWFPYLLSPLSSYVSAIGRPWSITAISTPTIRKNSISSLLTLWIQRD